ncbi:BRCT domain-containing protein At4g02110 [Mercurialis annua]|uniref:BRCT domain-containing protein At4g02110 n=1 Tax=Mercurialis annua TaxID=3986 RepID=UPI00215FC115|nr:BRCT domain-containing protein At4g02110 [Mercurialis annua]
METASPSKTFLGVRFVLFGFDPINESQARAKLMNGGGVDAGQYNQSCTHVIVDKVVYDDPVCVAARNDRKTVVTGLWVDHSYDNGMAVDATSIMYRPLRDLNGISGAKDLIMCLTGYQRQDRDDIMTMVSLMGAQFSKPLVANKVTHLLCYKFEGEKYELAHKLKKIKLINHRWLEDCLRDWTLLPEDDYNKSGYELEVMEAEAKDSEDDAEDTNEKQLSHKMSNKSPQIKIGTPKPYQSPRLNGEVPNASHNTGELEPFARVMDVNDMLTTPSRNHHASAYDRSYISEMPTWQDASALNDATGIGLPDAQGRTPSSRKQGNDLQSVFRSSEKSHSDATFSALNYTRTIPRKSPSSIFRGESGKYRSPAKVELSKSFNISPAKAECAKDLIGSGCKDLPKESQFLQKEVPSSNQKKFDISCSNHRYRDDAQACVTGSPPASSKIQGLDPGNVVHDLPGLNDHSPPGNHDNSTNDISSLRAAQKLHTDASTAKTSELKMKSPVQNHLFFENVTPGTEKIESSNVKTPLKELIESSLASKPEDGDLGVEKFTHVTADARHPLHEKETKQVPSHSNGKVEIEKFPVIADLEQLDGGHDCLGIKPGRKKTIAKRTLGSRPKLKGTTNKKGSIYSNKTVAQIDPASGPSGDRADHNKSCIADKLETYAETLNVTGVQEKDMVSETKSGEKNISEANFMDDETEPPEDRNGCDNISNGEKAGLMVNLSDKVADKIEILPEDQTANNTAVDMDDGTVEENNAAQPLHKNESTFKRGCVNGKLSKGQKQPSGITKTKTVPSVTKQANSKKGIGKEKGKPSATGQPKSKLVSGKSTKSSTDVEKENKPIIIEDQNISRAKDLVEKGAGKSVMSVKNNQKRKSDSICKPAREVLEHIKSEPALFLLSGHRLQRKEFQQVIKGLKGKLCRDSHQWSYQATHLIVPDPIRRTEKFFAAAASGRWILKSDYLTACSQAGRFLEEEPYEWHKKCLSEDGLINLEAPRRWRQLREKTGHGALYGMRIIIYGECIAPPLETLKRVVKAGDGTILATSPPYTRFLASGVDYAIISPGMPRVDIWVQEFLRHEIPCVAADYLVEYVCKPGYSLDKHVLYSTHAWAEKSFANLSTKALGLAEDLTPSDDSNITDDIACEVCGSRDRGDVMLVCGDESGSVGCGVGMHMDCCNPPLESIPDEDWFCANCSSKSSNSKRRKGTS